MAGRSGLPGGWSAAVALLAAAGLGIWSAERAADALGLGGRGRAPRPERPAAREPRGGAPVRHLASPSLTFGGASLQAKGGAPVDAGTPPVEDGAGATDPEERAAADALADDLRRLVRDLEWSPGLPEPRQQTVRPAPEPWRPPPGHELAPSPVIEAVEPARAPVAGGAQVTIRGRSLRPANVMFGRAPARIVSASEGAVVVVAPRGDAGPVAIAVTNEDGTFAIADRRFTYEPSAR